MVRAGNLLWSMTRRKSAALASITSKLTTTMPRVPDRQHLDSPDMRVTQERVLNSSAYLGEHIKDLPVLVLPCLPVRLHSPEKAGNVQFQASMYASIVPAAWNFMLAARARSGQLLDYTAPSLRT